MVEQYMQENFIRMNCIEIFPVSKTLNLNLTASFSNVEFIFGTSFCKIKTLGMHHNEILLQKSSFMRRICNEISTIIRNCELKPKISFSLEIISFYFNVIKFLDKSIQKHFADTA